MSSKTLLCRAAMLAAVVTIFLFPSFGCGGGGGGGNPPPNEPRSVNSPGNTVVATFGSRSGFTNDLLFKWIGDRTGTDFGVVKVTSVTKIAGIGDLSVVGEGRVRLINDRAYDVFIFDFTAVHPTGTGDPDAGKTVTGRATIHINPEQARVLPLSVIDITQDGSIVLRAQAQNSRASGWAIYVANAKTKLFVDVPEVTWTTTPGLDIANTGDGRVTVTAKTGFIGTATVTATYPGTGEQKQVTVNVIPHPTVGVSAPLEGATVSGNVTVTIVATNATKVTYQLGGGAETDVTGQSSFAFDSKTHPDGPLAITMRATGKLETVSVTRNVTVNNAPEVLLDGQMVLDDIGGDGGVFYTDSDGVTDPNLFAGADNTGKMYAWNPTDLSLMNADGSGITRTNTFATSKASTIIGDRQLVALPDQDNKRIRIYNTSGILVKDLSNLGAVVATDYTPGSLLMASDIGIREWNTDNWSSRHLIGGAFSSVSGDGTRLFVNRDSDRHCVIMDYAGTVITDLGDLGGTYWIRVVNGYNLVVISVALGPRGVGVLQLKRDGTFIRFDSFGSMVIRGMDRDWKVKTRMWAATGARLNGRPFLLRFKIVSP